jgi:Transglycosylase SLT domain
MLKKICLLFTVCMSVSVPAQADVWGYIDEEGKVHLADTQLDARYELFAKSPEPAPTAKTKTKTPTEPDTSPRGEYTRSVAVPASQRKLFSYFEVSPDFKAIKPLIRDASLKNKLDFELIQALIAVESGFNARALSPKGAVGLMQLIPPTAARYGVSADAKSTIEQKLFDPHTNIHAGSRYLADLVKLFPQRLDLALAAYNAGEGAVQKYQNTVPPYKETQAYVQTVMELYNLLKPGVLSHIVRKPDGRVQVTLPVKPRVAKVPATPVPFFGSEAVAAEKR